MARFDESERTHDASDELPSSASGARHITLEIDQEYGSSQRLSSSSYPAANLDDNQGPAPSRVPTWPELMLDAPVSSSRITRVALDDATLQAEQDLAAVRACVVRGDYAAAIEFGEVLLEEHPQHAALREAVETARELQLHEWIVTLGGMHHVPRLRASAEELTSLPLDPREAFVLSLVDGAATIEEIIDMAGMAEDEVLADLAALAKQGVLSFVLPR